jgi:hypothetical protein
VLFGSEDRRNGVGSFGSNVMSSRLAMLDVRVKVLGILPTT